MQKLTPEERRKIYEEEKEKLEGNGMFFDITLFALTAVSVMSLFLIFKAANRDLIPKLESLRRAFDGVSNFEE